MVDVFPSGSHQVVFGRSCSCSRGMRPARKSRRRGTVGLQNNPQAAPASQLEALPATPVWSASLLLRGPYKAWGGEGIPRFKVHLKQIGWGRHLPALAKLRKTSHPWENVMGQGMAWQGSMAWEWLGLDRDTSGASHVAILRSSGSLGGAFIRRFSPVAQPCCFLPLPWIVSTDCVCVVCIDSLTSSRVPIRHLVIPQAGVHQHAVTATSTTHPVRTIAVHSSPR